MLLGQPVAGSGIVRMLQEIFVKTGVGTTKVTSGVPIVVRVGSTLIPGLRFFSEEEVPGPVSGLSEIIEKTEEKSSVTTLLEKEPITI